jgi:hypothetical protein
MNEEPIHPKESLLPLVVTQPIIMDQNETDTQLSELIDHLLRDYENNLQITSKSNTPIHVDEIASRIARIYELARKVIDWKEDNVLRRSAIERILKRILFTKIAGSSFTQGVSAQQISEIVTIDLIRGGHLPNDEISRESLPILTRRLAKYIYILEQTKFQTNDPLLIKRKINFYTFVIEVAACEVEDVLTNPHKENSLILTMSQFMNDRIRIIPEQTLSPEDKYTQVYIAVCRKLYELDDPYIMYLLFQFQFPEWKTTDEEFTKWLQQNFLSVWEKTELVLKHPLEKDFNAICGQYDTIFMLIGDYSDAMKESPKSLRSGIKHKSQFLSILGTAYDKRYKTLKTRLLRLGIFSTLSVFLSNGFTFFLIEVPLASIFGEGFNLLTTIMDYMIPTILMFILVSIIKPPGEKNKAKVMKAIEQVVYANDSMQYIEIQANKKRHPIIMGIISIIYISLIFIMFGLVGSLFYIAHLPITSVFFDTFTMALTVFAAVVIRNKSKELTIDQKTHFLEFLLDMISVPIAKIGSFFAAKWKEYNVIAIFFNFVIETPFAIIIDFIESWSQFIKDRRSELH